MSQNDLAQRMGGKTSLMQVSSWERGVNRPGDERIVHIAEILKRDVGWFFTDHGHGPHGDRTSVAA